MDIIKNLNKMGIDRISIEKFGISAEINLMDEDKEAAWRLYVELVTRVSTQYLEPDYGDEVAALDSIHEIFGHVREISKSVGPKCYEFTRVAVIILNNVIRPFASQWHKKMKDGSITSEESQEFRRELNELQDKLREYTRILAEMAEVTDITTIA